MTSDVRILSVAPQFGAGRIPFAGHEEIYQLGLARAAADAGVAWAILAPVTAKVADGSVVPCLDASNVDAIAASLDRYLHAYPSEQGTMTGVVVYEADTRLAAAIARVAADHPDTRFLVNLFLAEPGLDAPLVRRKRFATQREVSAYGPGPLADRLARLAGIEWPVNLRLTAETVEKALLARSVGMPVSGTWRLHSARAERDFPAGAVAPAQRDPDSALRVLVALRSSQLHPPLVQDVVDVIERVARAGGGDAIEWVMAGRFDDHPRVTQALRRLRRAGVLIDDADRPLEPDAYARMFLDADVVWMPAIWPYRVQSSGKALDALVLGRPVIAPAGTAAAAAMQRWVPGAPTYSSSSEAAQLLLRLPSLHSLLREELESQSGEIRAALHPRATVEWLLEMLHRSDAEVSRPRVDVPLAPARAAPVHAEHGLSVRLVRRLQRQGAALTRLVRSLPRAFRAFGQVMWEQR